MPDAAAKTAIDTGKSGRMIEELIDCLLDSGPDGPELDYAAGAIRASERSIETGGMSGKHENFACWISL